MFFKEKEEYLNSARTQRINLYNTYFIDKDFKPEYKNLIGNGSTEITSNNKEDNNSLSIKTLEKKEIKRLNKLKTFKFERINYIILSPLVPVLFRKASGELDYFDKSSDPVTSPVEINQGTISNCYFISCLSSMAKHPELITRLFLNYDQSIGIYSTSLCINGFFREIIVDDFFPCSISKSDKSKKRLKLRMCHNNTIKEKNISYWGSILEKVYAKVFEGFWNIGAGGGSVRAFKDLTGAPVSFHFFDELDQNDIWMLLKMAVDKQWPMSAPTHQNQDKMNFMGIILNNWHSYSVLDVFEFDTEENKKQRFVKIRDPWGNVKWPKEGEVSLEVEKWVKKFKKWTEKAPSFESKSKGLVDDNKVDRDDGTLYITLEDFITNFSEVSICHYYREYTLSQKKVYFSSKQEEKDEFLDFVSSYESSLGNYILSHRAKVFQVIIKTKGKYYFSFSQIDRRFKEINKHHHIIINLVKPVLNGKRDINEILKYSSSKFLGGFSSNIRDPYLEAEIDQPGCYLLYLRVPEDYAQTSKYGTVAVYGPSPVLILPIKTQFIEEKRVLVSYRRKKFDNFDKIKLLNYWLIQALKDKHYSQMGLNGDISNLEHKRLKKINFRNFEGEFTDIFYNLTTATGGYGAAIFYNGNREKGVRIKIWVKGSNIRISKPLYFFSFIYILIS